MSSLAPVYKSRALLIGFKFALGIWVVLQVRLIQPIDVAVVQPEERVKCGVHQGLHREAAEHMDEVMRRLHGISAGGAVRRGRAVVLANPERVANLFGEALALDRPL